MNVGDRRPGCISSGSLAVGNSVNSTATGGFRRSEERCEQNDDSAAHGYDSHRDELIQLQRFAPRLIPDLD